MRDGLSNHYSTPLLLHIIHSLKNLNQKESFIAIEMNDFFMNCVIRIIRRRFRGKEIFTQLGGNGVYYC